MQTAGLVITALNPPVLLHHLNKESISCTEAGLKMAEGQRIAAPFNRPRQSGHKKPSLGAQSQDSSGS